MEPTERAKKMSINSQLNQRFSLRKFIELSSIVTAVCEYLDTDASNRTEKITLFSTFPSPIACVVH